MDDEAFWLFVIVSGLVALSMPAAGQIVLAALTIALGCLDRVSARFAGQRSGTSDQQEVTGA